MAREEEPDQRAREDQQHLWVEHQVKRAIERGDFDDLPGTGKPIEGLGEVHDPDWWVKKLIQREQITGALPEALQLRKDDARLDGVLDRLLTEEQVRRELADFNARVKRARQQLQGGPPVVTPLRDPDTEVERWRRRRSSGSSGGA